MITHQSQKDHWNREHGQPHMLHAMASTDASTGVKMFKDWLDSRIDLELATGIEMGCGKGRNTIWMAEYCKSMSAFDFSEVAIAEANRRTQTRNVSFVVADATTKWPFDDDVFDFGIDCFASSDIESEKGRAFARDEFYRVLKPGGYLFVHAISTQSEFHAEQIQLSPAAEKNSFYHPGGKFEKVYDKEELLQFYQNFALVECQLLTKNQPVVFYDKAYKAANFWVLLQKNKLHV